jgi:NADPH:quinone reductase-like Zn-dependent oxidoreductase
MDAALAIPKPKNINFAQASSAGGGVLTAFEGVFHAMKVPLLDPENLPEAKDEWVLVFGGASTVGKFTVQALKLSGYKVVTTCSAKSFEVCAARMLHVYRWLTWIGLAVEEGWRRCNHRLRQRR